MLFLALLAVACLAIGALARSWAALSVVLAVPMYFAGLEWGWWGYGTGDMWELAALMIFLAALVPMAAGVALGRMWQRRRPEHRSNARRPRPTAR